MLKYQFPRGNVRLRDMILLIADALYPGEDRERALKRVKQAVDDGRRAKKNPVPPGRIFYDKDFFEWALKRWPELSERIEDIPRSMRMTGYLDLSWNVHGYNLDGWGY